MPEEFTIHLGRAVPDTGGPPLWIGRTYDADANHVHSTEGGATLELCINEAHQAIADRVQGAKAEQEERSAPDSRPGPLGDGPSFAHDVKPLEEELALAKAHPEYGIDVEAVEAALREAKADAAREAGQS
jgi:hypothetical protein